MKVRVYVLGGVLGGLLALGPAAMAQGDTSGPAAGTNVAPQTGTGAGGAVGVAGPRGSENGPTPHVRAHSRRSRTRHMSRSGSMSRSSAGGTSGPAAGGNVAPQTTTGAGGAVGVAGPRGSENGPTPQPGSSNPQ